jgi:tRNA-dihydrouridine synthase
MTIDTHTFYLAPLRGVTDYIFRNTFEQYFGKFDYLVAPFTPTVKGTVVNASVVRDIIPDHNDIVRVIPQIIGNVASEILVMSQKMVDLGYSTVNFNLGCPFTPVARKKRGSGMLPYPEMVQSILEELIPKMTCTLSIKLRLGFHDEHEIDRVMPVLNTFPLKEITIHPRTGAQLYSGTVNLDGFQRALSLCNHTVVYNGDIFTIDDFKRISARFPSINKWMIGRGLVQNPFLLQYLKTDKRHFKKEEGSPWPDPVPPQSPVPAATAPSPPGSGSRRRGWSRFWFRSRR